MFNLMSVNIKTLLLSKFKSTLKLSLFLLSKAFKFYSVEDLFAWIFWVRKIACGLFSFKDLHDMHVYDRE